MPGRDQLTTEEKPPPKDLPPLQLRPFPPGALGRGAHRASRYFTTHDDGWRKVRRFQTPLSKKRRNQV